MARSGRPASESYQPASCSVSQSASYASEASIVGPEDEDERAPIFSLSKSSMDVVMATGPPHKRDPAWTAVDLRRSLSTNTHSDQTSATFQKLHRHTWQHTSATNSLQRPLAAQNVDAHKPPANSEAWLGDAQRWSACSDSTHSRSSTPDTIVWRAGASRPSSLTQDASCSAAPESPLSKVSSPSSTPSPFISPLYTPPLPAADALTSPLTPSTNEQEDLRASSPGPSPVTRTSSSFTCNTEDEGFLENNLLSFQFPSPLPSIVSIAEGGALLERECLNDALEQLHSPGDTQVSEAAAARSPEPVLSSQTLNPSAAQQEEKEAPVCRLELPWQPGPSCWTGRGWKSPLVSSLSDSQLDDFHRINLHTRDRTTKAEVFRQDGTVTSQLEMVDAAVQTVSPVSSWWDLKKNVDSIMDSHSILGSPPGSRLNLKSSVGSNSNLVSPSSSMFPVSSEEEEERLGDNPTWDVNSASLHDLERRRSCLKMQGDEADEMGRRSSMKQVQWDEEGVAWDGHGASVDPEVLSTAILKHLELQNSPQPPKKTSKKKKAPKPPLLLNVVKAVALELSPPVAITTSTCVVEGSSEGTPEAEGGVEMEEGGSKTKETAGAGRRTSRAEDVSTKEEEAYGAEDTCHPKSPSRGSGQTRKKSVIRSLRPGWCGGRRADD